MKYFRKRLAVLFAATLLAAGLIEVGARVAEEGTTPRFRRDPYLGWTLHPDAPGVDPETLCQISGDTTDASARRIFLLGDSFGQSDTFAKILERRLTESGHKVVVYNGGTSGYGVDQEYLFLRTLGPRVRPDVVVQIYFTGNDLGNLLYCSDNEAPKPFFSLENGRPMLHNAPHFNESPRPRQLAPTAPQAVRELQKTADAAAEVGNPFVRLLRAVPGLHPLYETVRRNSAALRYARRFAVSATVSDRDTGLLRFADLFYLRNYAFPFLVELRPALAGAFELEEALLLATVDETRRQTGRENAYLLVVAPHLWQVNDTAAERVRNVARGKGFTVDLDFPSRRLVRWAEQVGVPVLDLRAPFRPLERAGPTLYDGPGAQAHWSERGHDAVARSLAYALETHGLLDPVPQSLFLPPH